MNANQLIQTEGQVTAWRLDLGVQDVVTAAIVKQRWLSFQLTPWRCCVCFTPTPLHWHHSMSRRRTIENTWHNAARGNRKAVFVHTQPELSCDGWTDGVHLVERNLNKTKEHPQKTKTKWCSHAEFSGRLSLSPWGFLMSLYQKQEIVTQQKGSGLWISCIHLHMCVCVYMNEQGWKNFKRAREGCKQLHSLNWNYRFSLHQEAAWEVLPLSLHRVSLSGWQ